MEVRPGYKQTEVGIIPDDWGVRQLAEVADVKTGPFGSTLHERDYVQDGTPIITVEHLGDFGVEHFNLPMVSNVDRQRLQAYSLVEGDIVFSRVGSVDRNALIRSAEAGWLFSGRLLRVRPNKQKTYAPFLSFQFHSEPFKALVRSVAVGQTMASLNTQILNGIGVTLPPMSEQRAIAAALSDMDALLSGLDHLIAKKRDLKQAAMQQLLTGQTRLPGFQGEWEVKRLGDTASLKARIGWQGLTTAEYLDSGEFFLVTGTEFRQGYIDWNRCHFVDESRYKQDTNIQLRPRDVLVTKDGTIGKVALVQSLPAPATLNSGVFVIRPRQDSFYPEFFYYLLCSRQFSEFLSQLAAGSTISHLYQKDFVSFAYRAPVSHEEQAAIARALFDMDVEITALEARREKTRALKQAMMQELLTGRTRLV